MNTAIDDLEVSVICPVCNEEGNLPRLYRELVTILEQVGKTYEIIFVDDCSDDNSLSILTEFHNTHRHTRVIQLAANVGQTNAISAGLQHSRGEIIITMDADGQNVPANIPDFLECLKPGVDLVCGWRKKRNDPQLTRVLPSKLANYLIRKVTGIPIHDVGCGFKAFRLSYGKDFFLHPDAHRLLPALVADAGGIICEVIVAHRARTSGTSKYGFGRIFLLLVNLMLLRVLSGKAIRTLRLLGGLGLVSAMIGAGFLGVFGFLTIVMGVDITNRPILLLSVLLIIVGLQTLFFVLLAEMLSIMMKQGATTPHSYKIRNAWL